MELRLGNVFHSRGESEREDLETVLIALKEILEEENSSQTKNK